MYGCLCTVYLHLDKRSNHHTATDRSPLFFLFEVQIRDHTMSTASAVVAAVADTAAAQSLDTAAVEKTQL